MMLGAFAETRAAAVPQRSSCAAKAFCSHQPHIKFGNSMEFRTGLVKGPKKLEYGSIKKVEVAASTFLSNSLVSVCFLLHFIQSRHFCDNLSSQPVGNFPSFRNVEAATSTFPLWMGQNFYFPVSLQS